ncbi:non-ribosomal peptide synthetase [Mucilaginibacter sp. OK098]|uniref:non-ribosomal peptide synthetase n=1 Tax=Mucilaginibacter sp. OK098 TaxID=1855297 RepID=UPI001F36AC93|nr:non-ribosomal peptide synthetase [Mucilaginibacter sp. OK098]
MSTASLKAHLSGALPEYMIPQVYVQLASLPLTPNGKTDRKALPDPDYSSGTTYTAPETELEVKLTAIWSEVLQLEEEQISVTAGFFDLGGHSLKATTLMNRIYKELQVEVPLKAIFSHQDIRSLGAYISGLGKTAYQTIEKAVRKERYALSSGQQRMYFLYELDRTSLAYNMPYVVELEGALDEERLNEAFRSLIKRHESLRTIFEVVEGDVVQRINETTDFTIDHYEATDANEIAAQITSFIRPFDLNSGPLLRIGLVKVSKDSHLLLADMHHIITDGVSQGILIRDFMELYEKGNLPALALQYKDYSEWQHSQTQQEQLNSQRSYWKEKFSGELSVLELPQDHSRPSVKSYQGSSSTFTLNREETQQLKALGEESGATLFMTLLSVLNVLLGKLGNQEDITIGTPIAGRYHAELEGIIGLFVNTLALRNHPKGELSFREFLEAVKTSSLSGFEHQLYPYEELVNELELPRDTGRNPLFDVMFTFQNFRQDELQIPGLQLKFRDGDHGISKFDLTLIAVEAGEELELTFEYSTSLFEAGTIDRFISYFKRIVTEVTVDANKQLLQMDILSSSERNMLLYEFNATAVDYPRDQTIIDLFETQAGRTPDQTALILGKERMSYGELLLRADHEASILIARGVKQDEVVGLLCERSFELLIGMLGILKAGAAYMPLDPNYPADRISYMLEDSSARLLLSSASCKARFSGEQQVIAITDAASALPEQKKIKSLAQADSLAYVIYTSGSTGRPKGVMIPHRAVTNFSKGMSDLIEFTGKTLLSVTTFSFDIFVLESLVPLQYGATIVLADDNEQHDPSLLEAAIVENKVNMLQITPSLMKAVTEHAGSLKALGNLSDIMIGGEAFPSALLQTLQQNTRARIFNMYGPTETTVWSSVKELTNEQEITIGKPIANTQVYILNKEGQLQPAGVAGELCISGDGLSRGYLNKPELTAERFIGHPYKAGEKLYRTGDLARWLPDGDIEHLGRMDDQVKIRGYRIELGEIESQLLSYENIKEAVVVAKERNGEKYLAGYYVSAEELSTASLKAHLSGALPEYMIPQVYVQLTELPLTPNGKIDRKALPDPDYSSGEAYTAASTPLEAKLVEIWSEVLQLEQEQISVTAGFFDLGGHSLKATTLVNRIYKELQVEVPLKAIFSHQDIRSLGEYISGLGKTAYQSIEKAVRKDHYALSSGQQRMYFLYDLDRTSLAYNMPYVVELEGALDVERLNEAFGSLIARHESLRTTFEVSAGDVVQRINETTNFTISHYEAADAAATAAVITSFIRPFDLGAGPLIRVGLVKTAQESHLLLADMHHIITDGVSQGILIRDFMELYEKGSLPALALQYKDYSEWQHSQAQQEQLSSQRSYWKEKFSGELSVLDLPQDHSRPQVKSYQGSSRTFTLDREETKALKAVGEKSEATLFMTLLSVLNVLLGKLSNQEDITIGTPIAGRYHAELEGIIGLFVNTLALRNHPKGELSFREFLEEVKTNSLSGFENQLYPYEELVNELELPRDTGRNPLFDVMFTFQNFRQDELQIPGLQLKFRDADHGISKFDIEVTATVSEDELHFTFEYSTALFEAGTIDRFISYFKRIVTEVTADANKQLSQIDILSPSEQNRLLNEFNATAVDYPRDKTIIDLFEAQVERTPDNVAVVYGSHTLTYKELNEKADRLAAYLQQAEGVKTGDRVGLLLEREEELFPSIFGILKAGAVYVPLSVNYPSARLNTIITDAGLKVLITRTRYIEALSPEMGTGLLNLDISAEKIQASSGALQGGSGPADLAYIIYTSGSTGQPKGVMIEHGSVVNRLLWMQEEYPLSSKDVLLQKTSLVFDVSVWELFWWSFTGASVCVPAAETEKDPAKLIDEIALHGVTTIHFVPSMLSVFLDAAARDKTGRLSSLRQVFASGEALGAEQVNRFAGILYQTSGTRLINLYGPTEATVDVTYYECDLSIKNAMIPIGKPIANTQMYVLDKNTALSPSGVAGELCISGVGLSRGYLNKPELTAERFIDHPYKAGEKLYRTGDLARWLPDGNIEYLGRIDDQVKIRGYRIELGEIESQLVSHPEIREAVVVTREREGEKYLVGYYVSNDVLNISDLKTHLSKTLPEYMIPSYFVHLTAIPLSINGKADRKSLPKPELTIGESYVAPSNETERKLTAIWSEVLELDQNAISTDANFFELGGHSIHAVQVTNKIQGVFSVEMGLRQIFESNTVAELARFIEHAQPGSESSIPKTERKQYYLTSPAQERMYFGYLLDTDNTNRNISSMIELNKAPDVKQLEKAFQALIKRHSGLRTCFELTNEGVVQQIVPDVNFELKCFDLGNETLESCFMAFIQPFDLSKAPLIKALVVKGESKNYLFIDIHHIVCDGASVNILTRDLRDLYLGKKLPELELEYIDFAEWVRKETENQGRHKNYWSNKLYGNLKRLNLPILQERELVENNAVSKMIFSIGNDLYRKIKLFSREAEVTDFMFFLSVYYLMLNKITGDQDVIIGTDAIGRSSKDLQEIVGTFVNILPLRVDVNGSSKYSRFLNQVKECVLEAFDHQAYPYDQIVSLVSSEIKQLVDVHFSFDNTIDNGQELGDLQFKNVAIEEEEGADHRNTEINNTQSAEYDLEVVVSENEDQFQILFNYNSSLYDDDTIKIFIDIFINIISNVVNNPKIEIDKIGIESEVSMS